MTRLTCHAPFALAAGLLLAATGGGRGEDYRDAARHFTLTLPPGWEKASPEFIERMNAVVRQVQPASQVRYEAGFQLRGRPAGAFPYVLVQVINRPLAGATYEDLERGIATELNVDRVQEVQGKLADLARDVKLGKPVLDRDQNRLIVRLEMDVAGAGRAQAISAGMLGSDGIVFLHCYASKSDFEKSLPVFNALIDSFHYDSGYAFKPGTGGGIWQKALSGAGEGAVVGGVGGLLAAVVLALFRKRKPAAEPPADASPEERG